MKYTSANHGRVFVLRLEDGEVLQDCIEEFAVDMNIRSAVVQLVGGADKGSKIIVGPKEGRAATIRPMTFTLVEMHEVTGNGTIFTNQEGIPKLHCHIACGREEKTICGDIRDGVIVWHVMEVVITELTECKAVRRHDNITNFELLDPEKEYK